MLQQKKSVAEIWEELNKKKPAKSSGSSASALLGGIKQKPQLPDQHAGLSEVNNNVIHDISKEKTSTEVPEEGFPKKDDAAVFLVRWQLSLQSDV